MEIIQHNIRITDLQTVPPCSTADMYAGFRGTRCCLNLQGGGVTFRMFYLEDGRSRFFRNVDTYLPNHTASYDPKPQ
jgi:hypothetical protein